MRVFVCDNYDSFTFNLVQYIGSLDADVVVARNDELSVDDVTRMRPDAVVISPGPGDPSSAGLSENLVEWCADTTTPLLGVCLGHQAIGAVFGVPTIRAAMVMHGKTSLVRHDNLGVLRGLPSPMGVGRYHSLVLDESCIRAPVVVTARSEEGVVMGVRHESLPIEGVQFHPESVLTPYGIGIIENFLRGGVYALPT